MSFRLFGYVFMGLFLISALATASDDSALELPQRAKADRSPLLKGVVQHQGKAVVDTVYMMGGPDRGDGNFQHDYWTSFPDDEGWTSQDVTQHTSSLWHLSAYNAELLDEVPAINRAMWCGETIIACSAEDPAEGYPNNANEYLDWFGIVPDAYVETSVRVVARLNHDMEEEYDYLNLKVELDGRMETVAAWTGNNIVEGVYVPVDVDVVFTVEPEDYVGDGSDQVHLRWQFISDSGWSDGDCLYPTSGAAQIDNIEVSFNDTPWTFDDFQAGSWVNWQPAFPPSVGNFGRPWITIDDSDPCKSNGTPQWAFVDDGLVVPGTGGTTCTTWCYGPEGYVVNPEGGLAGPEFHLHNEIWSPPIAWPGVGFDGAVFSFDGYRHEPLDFMSPGVFYVWHIRSTADPLGETGWSGWRDRNYVYYGGPDYLRHIEDITDLLVADRTFVQVGIGVQEIGYVWGYEGSDATPAPYFDNAALLAYEFVGAAITAREIDIAQDGFPAIGEVDLDLPEANSVRFDMAMNISPIDHLRNDPGDSIVFSVVPVRPGSILNELPKLHYQLKRNPLFDVGRTSGLPDRGWVFGDSVFAASGSVIPGKFAFDLPDTGFFFPGDVLHYFIEATDNLEGDIALTLLPGDTSGFSVFQGDPGYLPMTYSSSFTVNALPSIHDLDGNQTPILIWNDFGGRGGENEWGFALRTLGFEEKVDYEVYYTNGPSSGVGNGLGGRASHFQLDGYETILYTVGDLSTMTISNGDYQTDPSNDLEVLDEWLRNPDRNLLLCGDDVVYDLSQNAPGLGFLGSWLPVDLISHDLRPLINDQATPEVKPLDGNPVFNTDLRWMAYGGCLGFNTFDAVEMGPGCIQLAEFLGPDGSEGAYSYGAAVLYQDLTWGTDILYLPYDFMYINNSLAIPPSGSVTADRTWVLRDILLFFGRTPSGTPLTSVPTAGEVLQVRTYPNPFNPNTRIEFKLPSDGRVSIKVFNLRGELVSTLLDQDLKAGSGHVMWDGTDSRGRSVSSGTYFCRTKSAGRSIVTKLSLVK